jgi:flagellar basal-body rod modification protein FlgD
MSVQSVSLNTPASTPAVASGSANSTRDQDTGGDIDVTFLNLLITELKSQDPTAPMDSTQMVGQMVALNQLDQLIGIRQLLQPGASDASSTATAGSAQGGN